MGHELTATDRMVSANEKPWHYAETSVDGRTRVLDLGGKGMTREVCQRESGLTYTVSVRPLAAPSIIPAHDFVRNGSTGYCEVCRLDRHDRQEIDQIDWSSQLLLKDKRAIVRDDTNTVLAICGRAWTPFQADSQFDFMDRLIAASEDRARYETAGSLFGGQKVWICCRLGGDLGVRRADGSIDPMQDYLVSLNQHGDNVPLIVFGTRIRPVCNNTVSWGLASSPNVVRMPHVGNINERAAQVAEAMKLENDYFAALTVEMSKLDTQPIKSEAVRAWAAWTMSSIEEGEFAGPAAAPEYGEVMAKLEEDGIGDVYQERIADAADKVAYFFEEGAGNRGDSKYDALNGLTEFLDHHRKRLSKAKDIIKESERRFDDIMVGDVAKRKTRAMRLLTRW